MSEVNSEAVATLRRLDRLQRDLLTRLDTIEAVTRSWIAVTDEHTIEGRRARHGMEIVRRMRERVAELSRACLTVIGDD
jgi:hypothetical protein